MRQGPHERQDVQEVHERMNWEATAAMVVFNQLFHEIYDEFEAEYQPAGGLRYPGSIDDGLPAVDAILASAQEADHKLSDIGYRVAGDIPGNLVPYLVTDEERSYFFGGISADRNQNPLAMHMGDALPTAFGPAINLLSHNYINYGAPQTASEVSEHLSSSWLRDVLHEGSFTSSGLWAAMSQRTASNSQDVERMANSLVSNVWEPHVNETDYTDLPPLVVRVEGGLSGQFEFAPSMKRLLQDAMRSRNKTATELPEGSHRDPFEYASGGCPVRHSETTFLEGSERLDKLAYAFDKLGWPLDLDQTTVRFETTAIERGAIVLSKVIDKQFS